MIPTSNPVPKNTPIPTSIAIDKPSSTPSPTVVLPQTLERDTADLYMAPGISFMFPPGWDIQLMNPDVGYYQQTNPLHLFIHPNGNIVLMFEILNVSDLRGDPSDPLERYSNLRM